MRLDQLSIFRIVWTIFGCYTCRTVQCAWRQNQLTLTKSILIPASSPSCMLLSGSNSTNRYAMRVTKGCARCRHRHVRCVVPTGASSCSRCTRLGRPCQLVPRFQFKPVRYIYQQCENAPTRFDLVWDEEQVWVGASRPGRILP